MANWDNRRFAELMAFSHTDAAQYCVDCGIDTEINWVSVYEIIKAPKEVFVESKEKEKTPETETVDDVPLLTKEELQELLTSNSIKFHPASGEAKLLQLAQENKLL